jgi:L-methionine (R)-S-oxide reductase
MKKELYAELVQQVESVLKHESNFIANLSNISSLMYWELNEKLNNPINWFGFYLIDKKNENQLILGPFHGKLACTRIKFGKGVCGNCISKKQTIIVPDVHQFEGHIACDSRSNSESKIEFFNLI